MSGWVHGCKLLEVSSADHTPTYLSRVAALDRSDVIAGLHRITSHQSMAPSHTGVCALFPYTWPTIIRTN